MSISYIEELCNKHDLKNLPALTQLKKAKSENRHTDVDRIANNILLYLIISKKETTDS